MAMDYLPIQASAVPCERVFSSSKQTMTARRNRIKPDLMEALQLLKFYLRRERLNFTAGWETQANDIPDVLEADGSDLLAQLLKETDSTSLSKLVELLVIDE